MFQKLGYYIPITEESVFVTRGAHQQMQLLPRRMHACFIIADAL
jgi:hypothetical protein